MKHTRLTPIVVVSAFLCVLSACAVTPERHREARLMPEKIALQIVAHHAGVGWAQNPKAPAFLANHPACNDQTAYSMPYKTMKVSWSPIDGVTVVGDYKVGFWCGTTQGIVFRVFDAQAQDDLIDALTSLGAKTKVN
jgi:hypothetical protein